MPREKLTRGAILSRKASRCMHLAVEELVRTEVFFPLQDHRRTHVQVTKNEATLSELIALPLDLLETVE